MTSQADEWAHHSTGRLVLDRVHEADVDDWHRIHADPRVWDHFPTGRHATREQTEKQVQDSIETWDQAGLGYWSVRENPGGPIIGCGGCRPVADRHRWNLYYRFDPDVQGKGYASELASTAIKAANAVDPSRPVVAYMLEHNVGSWRVAEKVGLTRIWVGPDEGNPDPAAVGLLYADRLDVEI